MKGIIPEKAVRVYSALLDAMQKYNSELTERRNMIAETDRLAQQNSGEGHPYAIQRTYASAVKAPL